MRRGKCQEEMGHVMAERGAVPGARRGVGQGLSRLEPSGQHHCLHLDLGLQSPDAGEKHSCCFKPPSLLYFIAAVQECDTVFSLKSLFPLLSFTLSHLVLCLPCTSSHAPPPFHRGADALVQIFVISEVWHVTSFFL